MSEWVDIPLATQMGEDDSPYVSDLELTNLMLKENPPGSRTPFHIASVPTLDTTSALTLPASGIIRGFWFLGDQVLIVQGANVYNAGFFAAFAGTAPCRMAWAGTHVAIVDGTTVLCVTPDGLSSVTPAISGFIDVVYQDGFTLYAKAVSNKVYASNVDDPTTIGALNFTTVDGLPGNIVGLASLNRELLVFKTTSIERFYNAGTSGFPFVRSTPGLIEIGCWPGGQGRTAAELLRGVNTIQEYGGVVYWLGDDLRVYAFDGGAPQVISTPWVERYLSSVATISTKTFFGAAYKLNGKTYYSLSGFTEGSTEMALVCDLGTGLWHKRYSSISSVLQINQITSAPGPASTTPYIAARNTGTSESAFYRFDADGTNDTGAASQVSRVMTLPQVDYGATRAFMPELLLDMAKPATTGTITLTWSDDGGSSYTSGLTSTGSSARTRWQRLGAFYQRILRLTFSIASKISIMGVRARIEVGE